MAKTLSTKEVLKAIKQALPSEGTGDAV